MSRLEVPKFKGPMSPSAIMQWLDRVSDSFDAFVVFNDDKKLTPELRILYAGLAMEEETAMAWWGENRADLRKLSKWEEFTARVLSRFAPDGWKANMVRTYYLMHQQSRPYSVFAAELQSARSAVGTTGPLGITDRIHTNHLLFHAHNTLQRRVLAIPGFDLETIDVDRLTSTMSATWDSLVAEGVVRTSIPTSATTSLTPLLSTATSRLPPLDDAEKKRISDASGCWKCRKIPTSPGWTPHIGRTCPGDVSLGILPGRDYIAIKTERVATIMSYHDDSESQPPPSSDSEDQPDTSYVQDRFTVGYTETRVATDSSYQDGNNESDSDSDGY
ncbi:hypothetical protein GGX14DRAFT_560915 [Mycena pura]|uniref:Retrotransposon gag domain-containing protein n=1 Tax=Mycena pura TaxID=153505 RepID=A0AAD6VW07_9AGAR|nr:hypothetical protein GGX14DRAFT_560915 [Mycena pura]